jgi:ATP-dependent helicase/nuclease subunit B
MSTESTPLRPETGFPSVPRTEVLRRLEQAGVVVVTPNRRLAAALAREYDALQSQRGAASWETPDILPFGTLVERLYEDGLYSDLASALPLLLSGAQEQALWEAVIAGSPAGGALLAGVGAAASARDAWRIAHAWRMVARLRGFPASDDAKAFADWAWRYEGITARDRLVDRARLPDVVALHLDHAGLRGPAQLIAYGFEIVTPQQQEFLAALAHAGVRVSSAHAEGGAGDVRRIAFDSAKDELLAAARWARARLESAKPAARAPSIGVVVPDLARARDVVRRVFTQVMDPGAAAAPRGAGTPPFNVSLGEPLASHALARAALGILQLAGTAAGAAMAFEAVSLLVRSPFIAGAESELEARSRLDVELRRTLGVKVELEGLKRALSKATAGSGPYRVASCSILARRLTDLAAFARENLGGMKLPGEWARAMVSALGIAGFPGERTLDSVEAQALAKLHETIAELAALDRVAGRIGFSEATERLARIAADATFQPQTPDVPVQILGVLESAGLRFDHLWITGLTEEAWPLRSSPNPFLPVALQRSAGVPESSPASALELDAALTRGWFHAAADVVVSHALREDDRELLPSPLVRDIPEARLEALQLPAYPAFRDVIRRAGRLERTEDFRAPAVAARGDAVVVAGGTGVFRNQAACPFRAYALHRLRIDPIDTPGPGLDASERGRLVHEMLAKLWSTLRTSDVLAATSERDLDAAIAGAIDHAMQRQRFFRPGSMEGRFAELERARLAKLVRAWLAQERQRSAFEVIAVEQKRALTFGGLTVNAKLDRMDRLVASGEHAILDYKTGEAKIGDWLGPRPDEPQLPLYALGGGERVTAVAFARVKAGEMEFRGVARGDAGIPGVKPITEHRVRFASHYRSWDELLSGWRSELDALGREFASGDARVQPKKGQETCRWCGLQPLCRIYERSER